jgi:hypothetical protein
VKRYKLVSIILCVSILACDLPAFGAVSGKIVKELIEATLERTIKRSGREMAEPGGKRIARESLEGLVKSHGDDALKVVDDAGLELLEAVPKYGDEVFQIAQKASPQARRAFAMNIPELLPLARRIGPEALELEAKSPGLSSRVFKIFGDDAGKVVAKEVPAEDVPRLLKYAEKADTCYKGSPTQSLQERREEPLRSDSSKARFGHGAVRINALRHTSGYGTGYCCGQGHPRATGRGLYGGQ